MRIAYVSLHWPRTRHSGVGKKIQAQMRLWLETNHAPQFFMHTSDEYSDENLIPARIYRYHWASGVWGRIRREYERMMAAHELVDAVASYHPDIIYLRAATYVFPLHRLATIAPLILEINTNDLLQHKQLGLTISVYNHLTRSILLKRATGLVCVTHELASSPAFRAYNKPTRVISNGIDCSSIQRFPAPANRFPRLVFIGSPGYAWHGVDKLVTLAHTFHDLYIDVIGYNSLDRPGQAPPNLVLHGYLSTERYQKILAGADVALGSLALHRIGLNEASPLKTRECLAAGIPMVLPYIDTDLDDLECDFLLKIPNREDNIQTHGKLIRDFAYQMRGRRVDFATIIPRIDIRYKEAKRLAFFEEIIQRLSLH